MILDTTFQSISPQSFAIVEPQTEGQFLATFLGWPELQAQGDSRQEALDKLTRLVQKRLTRAEFVPLELGIPKSTTPHSWVKFAGMFAGDEQFDAVMDEVDAYRQELDKNELDKRDEDDRV